MVPKPNSERGLTHTQIAVGGGVLAFAIVMYIHYTGGELYHDYNAGLAEDAFRAMQGESYDDYTAAMIEVWEDEVEDQNRELYYQPIIEHAMGKQNLINQYRRQAEETGRKARARAAQDFDWSKADYEDVIINTNKTSKHRLKGFLVTAGGKTYRFKFTKPQPGLHFIFYDGPVR